ncbi:MAG: hypothetical protein KDN20_04870 [Verrucomicrobiae bacterium]|nr:hypothetical protein [Verrucomicrobiae bacterium]
MSDPDPHKKEPLIEFFASWISPWPLRLMRSALMRRGMRILLGGAILYLCSHLFPLLIQFGEWMTLLWLTTIFVYGVALLVPPRWILGYQKMRWLFLGLSAWFCLWVAPPIILNAFEKLEGSQLAVFVIVTIAVLTASIMNAWQIWTMKSEQA